MRKRITTALSVAVTAIGMMAVSATAANAQNVWVFNQMDASLKPCFRVGTSTPWVDFGNVGAGGQFAWGEFLQIAKDNFGVDPAAADVLVRFTWVASGPGATCPAVSEEPNGKTVFSVDGQTPVYILVGGSEEVRKVVAGSKQDD
jgi:hypothetical protein